LLGYLSNQNAPVKTFTLVKILDFFMTNLYSDSETTLKRFPLIVLKLKKPLIFLNKIVI